MKHNKQNIDKLFSKPLPSSRSGAFYNTFPYPTKISPEAIAVYIASMTQPGDTVLDTFSGSGSTGIAALLCEHPTGQVLETAKALGAEPVWGKRNAVLYEIIMPNGYDFSDLPSYYTDCPSAFEKQHKSRISNIFIDPIRGRKIEFSTIHGVKGETHEATLYLETEVQNGSDLRRILQYYGIGNMKTNQSYERSRKLAYVGMSRPRKLLCVAMRAETYRMCKGFFDQDCEIIYLSHHDTNSASP